MRTTDIHFSAVVLGIDVVDGGAPCKLFSVSGIEVFGRFSENLDARLSINYIAVLRKLGQLNQPSEDAAACTPRNRNLPSSSAFL